MVDFLREVKRDHPDYFCRPVPPFGAADARLLVVGLAPGKHGANASGRPFTGDHAGILLYATLHRHGFASAPESLHRGDGLTLLDCRISNAVKCLPPANKPTTGEVDACNPWLRAELQAPELRAVLALGLVAHRAVLKTRGLVLSRHPFAHGAEYRLDDRLRLFSSYHCSRYNTQTRRLTPRMFDDVFSAVSRFIEPA
ncbi:MAG: uracil-DNA glycosylase [Pseudomonadota bacterium]|nr:uracil-DNA glycosylase [Pseudomonadota bacterium]